MKKIFSLAFLFACGLPVYAHYTYTPNLLKAQQAVFQLRLYDAFVLVAAERKADPLNRLTDMVEAYADCARLGIDEDRNLYKQLLAKRKKWEDDEKGMDESSPYYLFSRAEISLQWALVKLKFQDYVSAVSDVRSAYSDLDDNVNAFPRFQLNYRTLGVLKTMIGTVPDQYHWVLRVVGLDGSISEGTAMLQRFIQTPGTDAAFPMFRENARMQYAYLLYHVLKDKAGCWKLVDELTKDYRNNLFNAWNRASFAMKCGHTDEAIETLQNLPDRKLFYRFDYLDYLLGLAKLHRLDADADMYMKKYLTTFKGENYLKDACFKLYWFYLIQGNQAQAAYYRAEIDKRGEAFLDEDKHAQKAAAEEQDVILLKTRLLFDGGYYVRALQELRTKRSKDFVSTKLKTEYEYRFARIMHETGDLAKATGAYLSCIEHGASLPYYYAANSCLQLGYIYMQQGDDERAKVYFKKCMTFTNHEYKNSLSQKAKTGLKRLEERKK